jgi:hypothetical protein
MLEWTEDNNEESCVNVVMAEEKMPEGRGWRTPDSLWLEMEGEDEGPLIHINVVTEEATVDESRVSPPRSPTERSSKPGSQSRG